METLPFCKPLKDLHTRFVLEVTMRDGNNDALSNSLFLRYRFRSDYEGWKLSEVPLY